MAREILTRRAAKTARSERSRRSSGIADLRDTRRAMSQENVEVVRMVVDAYSRRDVDALRSLNHPDLELDWSSSVGTLARVYRGIEEALGFYDEYYETFESSVVVPDRYIDAGDIVVVPNVVYQRGRDGIEVSAHSTIVFTVCDGRVTRACLYQLEEEALKAVGLEE